MAGNFKVVNGKWFDATIIRVELLLYRTQKWPTKMLQKMKLNKIIAPQHVLRMIQKFKLFNCFQNSLKCAQKHRFLIYTSLEQIWLI